MSVKDFPSQAKQQQLALMIGYFSTVLLKTFYVTFYILSVVKLIACSTPIFSSVLIRDSGHSQVIN